MKRGTFTCSTTNFYFEVPGAGYKFIFELNNSSGGGTVKVDDTTIASFSPNDTSNKEYITTSACTVHVSGYISGTITLKNGDPVKIKVN